MSLIKIAGQFLEKRKILILKFLLVIPILLMVYLIITKVGDGKYYLTHEDEAIYYGSAKLFMATGSVQASGCNEEDVAPIGKINWYGPGFHIVYGSLFIMFGDHPLIFIWFHFFLALGIIVLILMIPISIEYKLVLAICLLFTQQLFSYVFTFFPETLVLFFATILTFLLYKICYEEDSKINLRYSILFVLLVFIFSLARITFIFWLIGWVVLGKSRKNILFRAILFICTIGLTMMYMKFLLAPTFASSLKKVDLLLGGGIFEFIIQVVKSSFSNLWEVVFSSSLNMNIFVVLLLLFLITNLFKRDKLSIPALAIVVLLLTIFLGLYVPDNFFFIKQTAMLLPLMILTLILAYRSTRFNYSMILVLLIIFPSRLITTNKLIKERRLAYENFDSFKPLVAAFAEIPLHIKNEPSIILWCYNEYDFGNCAEALLSFSTKVHKPILYSTNVVDPSSPPEVKFQLRGKLPVDYILSRYPLSRTDIKEVHKTPFYFLYQLNH